MGSLRQRRSHQVSVAAHRRHGSRTEASTPPAVQQYPWLTPPDDRRCPLCISSPTHTVLFSLTARLLCRRLGAGPSGATLVKGHDQRRATPNSQRDMGSSYQQVSTDVPATPNSRAAKRSGSGATPGRPRAWLRAHRARPPVRPPARAWNARLRARAQAVSPIRSSTVAAGTSTLAARRWASMASTIGSTRSVAHAVSVPSFRQARQSASLKLRRRRRFCSWTVCSLRV